MGRNPARNGFEKRRDARWVVGALVAIAWTIVASPAAADVANPAGTSLNAVPEERFDGTVARFSSTSSDLSIFSATIDWGDGTPADAGRISRCASCPSFGYDVAGSHVYARAGVFAVTVVIRDARDLSVGTAFGTATVRRDGAMASRRGAPRRALKAKETCSVMVPRGVFKYRGIKYKVILGTAGPDDLKGTRYGPDVIVGAGGKDTIDGRGKPDIICGGTGNDRINGGTANDIIFGGPGDDAISGDNRQSTGFETECSFVPYCQENPMAWEFLGRGHDIIFGGSGDDAMAGGTDDNLMYGEAGDDIILGAWKSEKFDWWCDICAYNHFRPKERYNDYLAGGPGDDLLMGSLNLDGYFGGAGQDECRWDLIWWEDQIDPCELYQ